ncbi:MAG: anthranilate synthase component I family protein [Bacteroidetes bacterium]|nr:MAG: anthranilate synthase component I family protein [Bacteroidota bacterium]
MQVPSLSSTLSLRQQALSWASAYPYVAFFDSCGSEVDRYGSWSWLLGVGGADTRRLESWLQLLQHQDHWAMGLLPYDLKNQLEPRLHSRDEPPVSWPEVAFFLPETVIGLRRGASEPEVLLHPAGRPDPLPTLRAALPLPPLSEAAPDFAPLMDRDTYLRTIRRLQQHIRDGDFYEINLTQAYVARHRLEDPAAAFLQLTEISPVPFAAYLRYGDRYLLSASPERFLQSAGPWLRSQPIKGTAPRGRTPAEDARHQQALRHSIKEQAENVMIVDLTRHDLNRSCETGSVSVPRLFEVQTFPQVHQLVSTVEGRRAGDVTALEALGRMFPPGSMTGAPKVMTMEMIDHYEACGRGAYAGSAGYMDPEGDFDLNVIIRSLIYDASGEQLCYHVGGAITYDSDPAAEYEETLVKARAIRLLFGAPS